MYLYYCHLMTGSRTQHSYFSVWLTKWACCEIPEAETYTLDFRGSERVKLEISPRSCCKRKLTKTVSFFVMFRHVSSCFVMFRHVSSCFVMFRHVSSCFVRQLRMSLRSLRSSGRSPATRRYRSKHGINGLHPLPTQTYNINNTTTHSLNRGVTNMYIALYFFNMYVCYAMPCHAMPCDAMLCYAMLCYAMLVCNVM